MSYLFDTHVLIWALANTSRLSDRVREILSKRDGCFYFSPVSVWEVAIKRKKHPDQLPMSAQEFRSMLRASGFVELRMTSAHAEATDRLPDVHSDPFDRMLVAQAQVEAMQLVTHDGKLSAYGDHVVTV